MSKLLDQLQAKIRQKHYSNLIRDRSSFREAQTGLWAKYNPEELATPRHFSEIPNWSGNGMHFDEERGEISLNLGCGIDLEGDSERSFGMTSFGNSIGFKLILV